MKQLLTNTICAILLITAIFSNTSLTFAGNATSLKETTFDLDVLDIDPKDSGGTEQTRSYFTDKRYSSPIVAFIATVINFFTAVIGSIAIILFIVAGFMYMFAQGDQNRLDSARDIIKYAAIGIVVTLMSYIIVISVQSIFLNR